MGRPATLKIDILADTKGVGQGVQQTEGMLGRLGSSLSGLKAIPIAGAAIASLGAIGAAGISMAKDLVAAGSDAEQSIGAVESIYGRYADSVERNADRAATAVGLSANQYRDMAAILGAQLSNMGRSQAEAAKQTDGLIRLGSDLAATYGGTVSDAVQAVSSLMKGETDPIERYGVSIKQSDINAQLAAKGLDKLTGAAGKQAQADAVLTLLTKQTTSAHHAFTKQSGSLAEQQQILHARLDNVKTMLGQKLLPVVSGAVKWFNDKLVPAASNVWHWFAEKVAPAIRDDFTPAVDEAKEVADDIARLFDRFGDGKGQHGESLARILRVIGKVGGTLAEGTLAQVDGAVQAIAWGFDTAADAVQGLIDKWNTLKDAGGGVLDKLGGLVGLGSGQLAGQSLALVGGAPRFDPRGPLATAAAGDPASLAAFALARPGSGVVVVDRRDLSTTVTVDGALDPVGVARQLESILDTHALRVGRVSAYGPGR